ncbi:hypothetical protein HG536_0F03110 [Torulaspora globosa]|uniref:BLOC-1-related complex subunit 5 n=1 Tax=Torulaspora globosa TaxID=48254 RepID=A0A7G3ZKF0_9SACH|nr:uncharacterized protein HG536_0F03110 [Torulaspora globosa]QLL33986.1 hypothetical protein HG536_0F03110 [Torulaspora globosa]
MAASSLRTRRNKHSFSRIEGEEAFDELKRLSSIPNHKQLTLQSIYEALEGEISQVKEDINCVYQAVRNDINLENEQMETVGHQLKKSAKKVNHMYDKVLASRSQNNNSIGASMLQKLSDDVENVASALKGIDNTVDSILTIFSQIDSRIPQKNRLLNGHGFNEQHYPLLFGLMHQKFGDRLVTQQEESGSDKPESIQLTENRTGAASPRSTSPTMSRAQLEPTEIVSDLITKYRISQAAKRTSTKADDSYLPPSLRRITAPSTKTTLETITAELSRNGDPNS